MEIFGNKFFFVGALIVTAVILQVAIQVWSHVDDSVVNSSAVSGAATPTGAGASSYTVGYPPSNVIDGGTTSSYWLN